MRTLPFHQGVGLCNTLIKVLENKKEIVNCPHLPQNVFGLFSQGVLVEDENVGVP